MSQEIYILIASAATIGFMHTVLGPDHYLPFIALAKAGEWSAKKTLAITLLCGIGHVLGSVVLGFVGIGLGIAVFQLESTEAVRGEIAAWLLLGFGLAYLVWGLRRAVRHGSHSHTHLPHDGDKKWGRTPWVLFIIFVFGPCEPLIPLVMVPAARGSTLDVVLVATVFVVVTVVTMTALVMGGVFGLARAPSMKLHRYSHALAGLVILLCGAAITFLDL